MPHDNTVSIAYEPKSFSARRYMAMIQDYQRQGIPFVGYLLNRGYLIRRTDRFRPIVWYKYDGKKITHMELAKLKRLGLISDGEYVELPKEGWFKAPTKTWFRAFEREIKHLQRGEMGHPRLLETVESDGKTTTYVTYGGY